MKRFLSIFFITLGVIFFVLLLAISVFIIVDPYNLRPLLFGSPETTEIKTRDNTDSVTPRLTPSQSDVLESVGIDADSVSNMLRPEMRPCFVSILGDVRVTEIEQGATPGASEVLSTRHCLSE